MSSCEPSYTRAQLAAAVDAAHALLHSIDAELTELGEAQPDRPRTQVIIEAIENAHDALHAVGAGLPRVGCATRDPEARRIVAELLEKLESTGLPCGHKLADLIGGAGAVTKCGACLAKRQKATP